MCKCFTERLRGQGFLSRSERMRSCAPIRIHLVPMGRSERTTCSCVAGNIALPTKSAAVEHQAFDWRRRRSECLQMLMRDAV